MGKRTNTATWSDKHNRWQINVQKDGKRRSFYSCTQGRTGQREANAKADAWLDEGILNTSCKVHQLWNDYIEYNKLTTSKANVSKLSYVGDNYLLPSIGHMKIEAVSEKHLQDIINKAYRNGSFKKDCKKRATPNETLSKKTLSGILCTMKAFIKHCRVIAKVTKLYPENIALPKDARYKGKSILQPSAVSILFTSDKTLHKGKLVFDNYIYAYRFSVATGLRPGELTGLWYGNINFKTGEVQIKRSINIKGETTNGKNENAIRSFVMNEPAKDAYLNQIELLKSQGIELNYNTPLFQISNYQQYYKHWKSYQSANELPCISLYEMRHTFVSIAKNLPVGKIKAIVGHSKDMDTFGIYGHMLNGEAAETAQELSSIFSKVISNIG